MLLRFIGTIVCVCALFSVILLQTSGVVPPTLEPATTASATTAKLAANTTLAPDVTAGPEDIGVSFRPLQKLLRPFARRGKKASRFGQHAVSPIDDNNFNNKTLVAPHVPENPEGQTEAETEQTEGATQNTQKDVASTDTVGHVVSKKENTVDASGFWTWQAVSLVVLVLSMIVLRIKSRRSEERFKQRMSSLAVNAV
eukprot:g33765.t1